MRPRRIAVVAALAAASAAVWTPWAGAEQSRTQVFFRDRLLNDARTSDEIKQLLAPTGGGFVDRSIAFRDLTGDERTEAVIRVQSAGAAGVVAVYVFSSHRRGGERELRPIFRSQSLRRASTRVTDGVLRYRYSAYADGDELCCPSRETEATLRWDRAKDRLVVAGRADVTPTPSPTS